MPQRRVAPTGFGGSPGAAILAGVARGKTQRREEQREVQRQAVLNRLREVQMDRAQQQIRHAQEDQEFEVQEREKRQQAAEEQAGVFRDVLVEDYGYQPSRAEELSLSGLQAAFEAESKALERERTEASIDATRTSAASNRQLQEQRDLQMNDMRAQQDASKLMANPNYARLALDPDISEESLLRVTQSFATDQGLSDRAVDMAMRGVRSVRSRMQEESDPSSGGGFAEQAAELVAREGGVDAAIEYVKEQADAAGREPSPEFISAIEAQR